MSHNLVRPSRTSMEGMIWNANHVLEQALSPRYNGVPKKLFNECAGIVLISVVEVGFIFSGNVGTGILLKKNGDKWSPPSACGLTGLGYGFLIGASVQDIMVFLPDEETVNSLATSSQGLKLGTQGELTVGPFGRKYELGTDISKQGLGTTIAIAFTKGAFAGISVSGAVVGARPTVNNTFYGRRISPQEILNDDNIFLPTDKVNLLEDVYHNLELLSKGETMENDDDTHEEKKKVAAKVAETASAALHAQPDSDVVQVDAAAEAAKEAALSSK